MNELSTVIKRSIRNKLVRELELFDRIEELIVDYRIKLKEAMELCSKASDLESFEMVDELSDAMSSIGSDLRELDDESRMCVMRINVYRKILGLKPMKGAA